MPLYYIQRIEPSGVFAIWDNQEEISYYEDRLQLTADETELLEEFSDRKKMEWLSSRNLLHIMTGAKSRTICVKDEYGKPLLLNSEYHISLSHSADRTAVIASKLSVGIDIQKIVSKIGRIAKKFCNEEELDHLPNEDELLYYHIIWGAKECIYKSYGKRKVDFRRDMTISKIGDNLHSGVAAGTLKMDAFYAEYRIEYHLLEDYMVVTSVILK